MNLTGASCKVKDIKHYEVIGTPGGDCELPHKIKFEVLLTKLNLRLFMEAPRAEMPHTFDTEAASGLLVMAEEYDPKRDGAKLKQQQFDELFGLLLVTLKSPFGHLEFEGVPKGDVTCSVKLGGVGATFWLESRLSKPQAAELAACVGSILFSCEPLLLVDDRGAPSLPFSDDLH